MLRAKHSAEFKISLFRSLAIGVELINIRPVASKNLLITCLSIDVVDNGAPGVSDMAEVDAGRFDGTEAASSFVDV